MPTASLLSCQMRLYSTSVSQPFFHTSSLRMRSWLAEPPPNDNKPIRVNAQATSLRLGALVVGLTMPLLLGTLLRQAPLRSPTPSDSRAPARPADSDSPTPRSAARGRCRPGAPARARSHSPPPSAAAWTDAG